LIATHIENTEVNNVNKIVLSLRPVAAATALMALSMLGAGAAWAGDDDVPLSLSLSHDIRHDNNFAKNDDNKYGETVNATTANFDLNKAYGRQTYRGGLSLTKEQYARNEGLNNDSKNANVGFSSELARSWLVTLGGSYSQALNPIQNNVDANRIEKNLRTYRNGSASIKYGNGGTWAVLASYEGNRQGYSAETQQFQDYKQHVAGLRAIYLATDILSYSLGTSQTVTDYDKHPTYKQVVDKDLTVSVDYQATGLSLFNATVGRRSTSYDPSDLAGSRNWTGSADWYYTPQGIMTYSVSFARTTGTDRTKTQQNVQVRQEDLSLIDDQLVSRINNDTVTTSLTLGARASLTGKISVRGSYTATHYKISQTVDQSLALEQGPFRPTEDNFSSNGRVIGLSLDYAALRSVLLGCSFQKNDQTRDLYRLRYSGHTVACNARFTINP
jgi:hypothetical protein